MCARFDLVPKNKMCYCIACLYCVHVLQRNWIKDMDTGAVYVLNGDTDAGGGGGSGGAAGAGRVTELLSGKELRWVLLFAAAAARDMDAGRQAWAALLAISPATSGSLALWLASKVGC